MPARLSSDTVFEGGTRYAAQGFDPNDMAVTLALGIPMATYLALDGGSRRWKHLMLLYLPSSLSPPSSASST